MENQKRQSRTYRSLNHVVLILGMPSAAFVGLALFLSTMVWCGVDLIKAFCIVTPMGMLVRLFASRDLDAETIKRWYRALVEPNMYDPCKYAGRKK